MAGRPRREPGQARADGRGGDRGGGAAAPRPAAYRPASAWLNDATSPALRVVGEQRQDVVVRVAEDVLDEAVQRPLGADLDEHPRARVVQRLAAR